LLVVGRDIFWKNKKKDFNFTREPKVPFETLLPEGVIYMCY
jgi:hypothetical protein